VQFEDAKGKTVVEKHSTGRILKMLAGGQLTAKARCKVSADGAYYPLAQFPEFAKAVEDSLSRKTAAIRKEDMQSLYKKVDREQKMFQLKRKVKDFFRNIVGFSSLILLVGGVLIVAFLVWQFGRDLPSWISQKLDINFWNSSQSTDSPTTTPQSGEALDPGTAISGQAPPSASSDPPPPSP
jgi:hypothetical protein